MHDIEKYYATPNLKKKISHCRGEFWYAFYPEIRRDDLVLELRDNGLSTEIKNVTIQTIENRKPLTGQFDAMYHFKRRPVIVLSTPGSDDCSEWELGKMLLVAPIYSLRDSTTGEYKASVDFVWNMAAYLYPQLFYLPKDDQKHFNEAYIRLDSMMVIPKGWMIYQREYCLTEKMLGILNEWLKYYISGELLANLNQDLCDYRALLGSNPSYRSNLFPVKL